MSIVKAWFLRNAVQLGVLFVVVLVPLVVFGMLAEDVVEHEVFRFDRPILLFLHAHATPGLDAFMLAMTRAGSVWALVPFNLLVTGWLLMRRQRSNGVFWLIATAGAALINLVAKHVFVRVRPSLWISEVHETTYSFPSGHAMSTMATVAALLVLLDAARHRLTVAVFGAVFVLLVGVSRVYFGVHYPSDVLGGWLASLAWVTGLALLMHRSISIHHGRLRGRNFDRAQ